MQKKKIRKRLIMEVFDEKLRKKSAVYLQHEVSDESTGI